MLTASDAREIDDLLNAGFAPAQLMELAHHHGWSEDDMVTYLVTTGRVAPLDELRLQLHYDDSSERMSAMTPGSQVELMHPVGLLRELGVTPEQEPQIFDRR
jgi:hypothetical protein